MTDVTEPRRMSRYETIADYPADAGAIVLTIGNFDGVHRGHHALLDRARRLAAPDAARVVAMTFEPHPISILRPEAAPPRLTTAEYKLALLERAGADDVIVLASRPELFAISAHEFFERYIATLRPLAIVEGPTFRFGHNRDGTIERLRELAASHNIRAEIVDEVVCPELPSRPVINSSTIRRALQEGRVEHANIKLGRPHRIAGVVGHGAARGREIGFPTANVEN
ncbi:MAG: bifunctional riboflavin kinase/FAD synthetase, partial [Planctomycetota bacterium]